MCACLVARVCVDEHVYMRCAAAGGGWVLRRQGEGGTLFILVSS